ncbi:hypothetical protein [Stenotrophomonas sp. CFBP 13718]|uniref:hypothetical protein n=1 Tax=Stenotrophomonas sp. CFBP 13718 TaxID=2775304 RepID=UPI0017834F8E|nr:hypothetical protein [Stenotrophomonas sp. CFBP 13718]MBD8696100.1 hypothetical protein [Stenotrophomonas sp. CFBP 13718]
MRHLLGISMRYSCWPTLLMLGALTLSSTTVAADAVRMPKALRGMWDWGPTACRLELSPDTQSPIWIEAKGVRGYESNDVPVKVTRVHIKPSIWVIESVDEALAPGVETLVYVLAGDTLAITDGRRSTDYHRCEEAVTAQRSSR